MARADLLRKLIESGLSGNSELLKKTVQAIIAEEKNKNHGILANELERLLIAYNHPEIKRQLTNQSNSPRELQNLIIQVTPQKVIEDLFLDTEIVKSVEKYIKEYHRRDLLRSYNVEPRNRLLFTGSPGNGKTSLAEAIANSLMLPMYIVRYDGIIGSYLGETSTRLRKVFDYISTQNCILFFDEFDAIAKERGDIHETGEIKRVVNSLLMQIDVLPEYVIVIAATNHPELLDRAVWRRFQIRMELNRPNQKTIAHYLEKFATTIKEPIQVDFNRLAKQIEGSNFSDIEEMTKEIRREYVLSLPKINMDKIIKNAINSLLQKNNRL
ncbi:MAG: AAA family ATPase [Prolixibacteraceae bacterium]|nr:AAA family ATPase [Prolixibacteraceae bacterium]